MSRTSDNVTAELQATLEDDDKRNFRVGQANNQNGRNTLQKYSPCTLLSRFLHPRCKLQVNGSPTSS